MSTNRIVECDRVRVVFESCAIADVVGYVRHIPQEVGDWWVIEKESGEVVNVILFAKMYKEPTP